jgi:hypothetical protein
MTNYNYSQYGTNPNGGRNANADNGWGGYQWPNGVPANLLANAKYGGVTLQVRKELFELVTVLMQITESKYHYNLYGPAERPPAGWCWGYSNRAIAGTSTASNHSKGRAVDLNAPNNPYTQPLVCDIPPDVVNTWERAGFYWGGRYTGKKDAMHFEYCWTPNDVNRHLIYAKSVLGGQVPPQPQPQPQPKPPIIAEDDDMMQLLKIAGGNGKIYAASVVGRRFYYVGNPDSLAANQKAGTYSQDIKEIDQGQMNHVRYACSIQQDDDPATPIP